MPKILKKATKKQRTRISGDGRGPSAFLSRLKSRKSPMAKKPTDDTDKKVTEGRGIRARDILRQAATRARLRTLARDVGNPDAGETETVDAYEDRVGKVGSAKRKAHKKKWAEGQAGTKESTEHEGSSVSEAKKAKKWRATVSQYGKKLTKGNPKGMLGDISRQRSTLAKAGTIETGKFTAPPGEPIRMKKHKLGKEYMKSHPDISYTRDDKGTLTVAHTEYEGPSVYEVAARASSIVRGDRPKAAPLGEDSKKGYPGIKGGTSKAKKEMERRKSLGEAKDKAPTGGSYSTYAASLKDKIRRLMNPPKGKKKLRPGVAATKAGRRRQSRETKGSGVVLRKKPHSTEI